MKYLNKIYSSLFCFIIVTFLYSCNDEDNYDICGSTVNKIFLTNSTVLGNFQIQHSYLGSTGKPINIDVSVSSTQRVSEDVYVQLSIDNSYIEQYNLQHGTTYTTVPEELILFENNQLKIPANSKESESDAKVSIQEKDFSKLREDAYLIPIVIESISENIPVSEERKIMYSIITTMVDLNNIDAEATPESANVTFIEDRSAWTGEWNPTPNSITGNYTYLLDSNENTSTWTGGGKYYSFSNNTSSNISLIMDLNKEYEIAGIYLNGVQTGMKIFVGTDKTEWTEMGTVNKFSNNILFYVPFNARYVRCEFQAKRGIFGGYSCSAKLLEFKCYVKNN